MSHPRLLTGVVHSAMRPLKELYLSIFVLFYRLAGWEGRMKAGMAALCVSVVESLIVLIPWGWIQVGTHQYVELNRWIVVAAAFVIGGPTDYILVVRGCGVAFERQFNSFSQSKRTALYLAAIGIVATTGIAFYFSVAAYHLAFNLPQK